MKRETIAYEIQARFDKPNVIPRPTTIFTAYSLR